MRFFVTSRWRLGFALVAASLAAVGLYAAAALSNQSWEYNYLVINLLLAWIPLGLALLLARLLKNRLWSNWLPLTITAVWLVFLPNSFYIVTDLIHLHDGVRVDPLFDAIVFTSFIVNGLVLGFVSLFVVNSELSKRVKPRTTVGLLGLVLLLSSFGMYIGRELRWNSWDIVAHPVSMLFDVTDRLINLGSNPLLLPTTLGFFVLLVSGYIVFWQLAHVARQSRS